MIKYLIKVKRQTYTNWKSAYSYTWKEYKGVFYSSGIENVLLDFDKLWKEFYIVISGKVDILESDILEINNQAYSVKAIEQLGQSIRKQYLKILVYKNEN